jgi:methionyl-tRNA synthetase
LTILGAPPPKRIPSSHEQKRLIFEVNKNDCFRISQGIFTTLHKKNRFLTEAMEQLYCEQCQRFLADRYVEGICPLCKFPDARGMA